MVLHNMQFHRLRLGVDGWVGWRVGAVCCARLKGDLDGLGTSSFSSEYHMPRESITIFTWGWTESVLLFYPTGVFYREGDGTSDSDALI